MVVDRNFDWSGDNFQMPQWNELVVYELHLRSKRISALFYLYPVRQAIRTEIIP